jgi:hypothetical protein
MENSFEAIMKWLRQSGLKVNESKNDLCFFYKNDIENISIKLNDSLITSSFVINVLVVKFDSKLQWSNHVAPVIVKANKGLNVLNLIHTFFRSKELIRILILLGPILHR